MGSGPGALQPAGSPVAQAGSADSLQPTGSASGGFGPDLRTKYTGSLKCTSLVESRLLVNLTAEMLNTLPLTRLIPAFPHCREPKWMWIILLNSNSAMACTHAFISVIIDQACFF